MILRGKYYCFIRKSKYNGRMAKKINSSKNQYQVMRKYKRIIIT